MTQSLRENMQKRRPNLPDRGICKQGSHYSAARIMWHFMGQREARLAARPRHERCYRQSE